MLSGSWEDLTSQFLQDCDHSQALFKSADSATDVFNHGFALLAVLFASFSCDNRFSFYGCDLSLFARRVIFSLAGYSQSKAVCLCVSVC